MADERAGAAPIFTIANGCTYARLILLPFVIGGVATRHGWLAVIGMIAIWVTDLLDGRLARRLGQAGEFGKTLDSTIDFTLIYSLFITFYAAGRLTTSQFAFLYLAMLAILSLQMVRAARGGGADIVGTTLGKLTGALQYAYLLFLVALEVLPYPHWLYVLHAIYFLILAATTVLFAVECGFKIADMAKGTAGTEAGGRKS
jgi:phosphatidylglycerophosphate synthase